LPADPTKIGLCSIMINFNFCLSDLIILASRPSIGKTALALMMLYDNAVVKKVSTVWFTFENSAVKLVLRLVLGRSLAESKYLIEGIQNETDVTGFSNCRTVVVNMINYLDKAINKNGIQIRNGRQNAIIDEAGRLYDAPLYFIEQETLTIDEIIKKIEILKNQHDVKLIFIDCLNMIHGYRTNENKIFKLLKDTARELNIGIVGLLRLPQNTQRKDFRSLIPDAADMFMVLDTKPGEILSGDDVTMMNLECFEKKLFPKPCRKFSYKKTPLFFHAIYSMFGRPV
jgi:replicative DNA helicase